MLQRELHMLPIYLKLLRNISPWHSALNIDKYQIRISIVATSVKFQYIRSRLRIDIIHAFMNCL